MAAASRGFDRGGLGSRYFRLRRNDTTLASPSLKRFSISMIAESVRQDSQQTSSANNAERYSARFNSSNELLSTWSKTDANELFAIVSETSESFLYTDTAYGSSCIFCFYILLKMLIQVRIVESLIF